MMRWIGPAAILVASALAAHWATLAHAPGFIMDRTLSTLKERGVALHAFTTPVRISPETQVVVRSSPDLFYSLCRYDLNRPSFGDLGTNPRIIIQLAEWDGYQSLSFFDEETNNFATLRASGETRRVSLFEYADFDGETLPVDGVPTTIVNSPTKRGVILIRRLAPTPEAFAKAVEAARRDRCDFTQPPAIEY